MMTSNDLAAIAAMPRRYHVCCAKCRTPHMTLRLLNEHLDRNCQDPEPYRVMWTTRPIAIPPEPMHPYKQEIPDGVQVSASRQPDGTYLVRERWGNRAAVRVEAEAVRE